MKVILRGLGVGAGEGLELRAGELGKEEKKRLDGERNGGGRKRCLAFPLRLLLPFALPDLVRLASVVARCEEASEIAPTATCSSGGMDCLGGAPK